VPDSAIGARCGGSRATRYEIPSIARANPTRNSEGPSSSEPTRATTPQPSFHAECGTYGAKVVDPAGFLLVDGIVGPVAEELVRRGVIQTALMESYGVYAGGAIAALAFVLKHLIVDTAAPFLRVISLVILASLLSGLRARYGTASSTVAHVAINSIASAAVLVAALCGALPLVSPSNGRFRRGSTELSDRDVFGFLVER
jgi:membrane protease YdiL (CAAX protease family)